MDGAPELIRNLSRGGRAALGSSRWPGWHRARRLLPLTLICAAVAAPGQAGVGPPPASDAALAEAVEKVLGRDDALRRLRLRVEAEAGSIRLVGSVPTLALKREAVRRTAGQRGVLAIEDQLTLGWAETADRTVQLRLNRRLSLHSDFRPPNLLLSVLDGEVSGTGRIGTIGRKLFLERLITQVEGVRSIDLSGVLVEGFDAEPPDDAYLQEVVTSLLWSREIFPVSGRFEVEVEAAQVTLVGSVPRLIDRMEAVEIASRVPGIAAVVDELEVDPGLGLTQARKPSTLH
jgi:osmotically-inducible protein OsmY